MGDLTEDIQLTIYDKLQNITLKSFGLAMCLITVVLSLLTVMLVIFEVYGTGRLFATFTLIAMVGALVSLGVHILIKDY